MEEKKKRSTKRDKKTDNFYLGKFIRVKRVKQSAKTKKKKTPEYFFLLLSANGRKSLIRAADQLAKSGPALENVAR